MVAICRRGCCHWSCYYGNYSWDFLVISLIATPKYEYIEATIVDEVDDWFTIEAKINDGSEWFQKTSRSGRKNATMADADEFVGYEYDCYADLNFRSPSMELSSTELPIHRL